MSLLTRIKRLEQKVLPSIITLAMPDGSLLRISGGAPLECLYEILDARRENREASHPYLTDILRSVSAGGGSSEIVDAVKEQYRLTGLLSNPEPNRNMEDFEEEE